MRVSPTPTVFAAGSIAMLSCQRNVDTDRVRRTGTQTSKYLTTTWHQTVRSGRQCPQLLECATQGQPSQTLQVADH